MLESILDFLKEPKVFIPLILIVAVGGYFLFFSGSPLPPAAPPTQDDSLCGGKAGSLCYTHTDGRRFSFSCSRNAGSFLFVDQSTIKYCSAGCSDGKCNSSSLPATDEQGRPTTSAAANQADPVCTNIGMVGCVRNIHYSCAIVNGVAKVTVQENCQYGCTAGGTTCRTSPSESGEGGSTVTYGCTNDSQCASSEICVNANTAVSRCMRKVDFCSGQNAYWDEVSNRCLPLGGTQPAPSGNIFDSILSTIGGFGAAVGGAVLSVPAFFGNAANTVLSGFGSIGTGFETALNNAYNSVVSGIGSASNTIVSVIGNFPSVVTNTIGSGISALDNTFNPFNGNSVVNNYFVDPIVSFASNIPQSVGNVVNSVSSFAGNTFNTVSSFASGAVNTVSSTISNVYNTVTNSLCNLTGWC